MRSFLVLFAAVAVVNANTRLRDESVPKNHTIPGLVGYHNDGIYASVQAEQNQTNQSGAELPRRRPCDSRFRRFLQEAKAPEGRGSLSTGRSGGAGASSLTSKSLLPD